MMCSHAKNVPGGESLIPTGDITCGCEQGLQRQISRTDPVARAEVSKILATYKTHVATETLELQT